MINKLIFLMLSFTFLFSFQSSIEERLYSLNRDLMCPVCDGLTLEQSQAGPALEMKDEIKKMVIKGMSDQEIKEHFVDKFGIEILANPPKKGFDALVWLAPLVFGFLGIVLLYRYFFS
ncbi:MAG: cytochrome c-type biogenesis protein CcmH [Candidatus Pelagibacter sp. TMED118]|nr:MAG: cytochrome c-type biogenesis protein CcmH [Candidatus Pelagibacter sp. TMED118]